MKRKAVLSILAVLLFASFSSVSLAAIPVKVAIGKGTILTLKEPSKRISMADPEIAELNLLSPFELLINGKKIGTTNLIVWDTKGKPTFFDIIVMGDIASLENELKEIAPGADVYVETVGDVIILRGDLTSEVTKAKMGDIAEAFAPSKEKVINLVDVKEAEQVLLEVTVAQVDKSKLMEMGLGLIVNDENVKAVKPGGFIPQGIITPDPGGTGGQLFGFDLEDLVPDLAVVHIPGEVAGLLRALSQRGYAKILAEPNMVVRSGEEGSFHVGTRFPIQVIEDDDVEIQYEDIGVLLNFAPVVLETGVIRLNIDPAEVSNIVDFVQSTVVVAPIIDTRTVRTSVDLREGESLIMAGLLSEETIKNIRKIPLLGDVPIFGAIFRSTSDELREKELAFFITPKRIKPFAPGEEVELPTDKELTTEEEREFKWVPLPKEHDTID